MDMTGEQLIPLGQQQVWEALNDPAILKDCIMGCDVLEKVSDTEFKVGLVAAIGPVKAKFAGKLLLLEMNPPNSYALAFEGSGGWYQVDSGQRTGVHPHHAGEVEVARTHRRQVDRVDAGLQVEGPVTRHLAELRGARERGLRGDHPADRQPGVDHSRGGAVATSPLVHRHGLHAAGD